MIELKKAKTNDKIFCIFLWILVILWAGLIFFMSSMDTNESNGKSKTIINDVVEKSVETTNGLGITDKHPSENKMNQVIEKLNYPLRKAAHASEYFIFTILILIALKNSGVKGNKRFIIALVICFIYACTDEYHQTFVNGRTGQFSDTLIDTFGGFVSCLMYTFMMKINKIRKKHIWFVFLFLCLKLTIFKKMFKYNEICRKKVYNTTQVAAMS